MITIYDGLIKEGGLMPSSCIIKEELNGLYELEMIHSYDEFGKWSRLSVDKIIYADTPKGKQPFRIYNIEPNIEEIKVNARHIFYDLLDNFIVDLSTTGTAQNVLNAIKGNMQYSANFNLSTDITASGAVNVSGVNPVEALLGKGEDTFLSTFGGELDRNGYNIAINLAIGKDRGYSIAYGKNLVGLTITEDIASVVTRYMLYNDAYMGYLDSARIGDYDNPKIAIYENADATTLSQLKEEAQALFDAGADLPTVNIKADFVLLQNTEEYKDYKVLEEVFLGDVVTVRNKKMNFSKKAKVISYEYDALLNRYNKIELGDFLPNIYSSVTSGVNAGAIAQSSSTAVTQMLSVLNAHIENKDNPHEVTCEQVECGSGGDVDLTEIEQAISGLQQSVDINTTNITDILARVEALEQGGGGLPDGYTLVDYIESTGTQYIDTGFMPNNNTRVIMDEQLTSSDGTIMLFGARISATSNSYAMACVSGVLRTDYNNSYSLTFSANPLDRLTIDKNKETTIIGNETQSYTNATFQAPINMFLFAVNNNGEERFMASAKLYSCQIYNNDTLIRDYIPALDSNGVPCLFDKVSKTPYYNGGTGSFKYSLNGIPSDYAVLNYIESSGAQYINTGFMPNQDSRLVLTANFTSKPSATVGLFGVRDGNSNQFYFGYQGATNLYTARFGTTTTSGSFSHDAIIKSAFDMNKNKISVNGVTVATLNESAFSSAYNLYLFAFNNAGATQYPATNLRVYSCQIYDNGTLVRDFIPVLHEGTFGLFDKVNQTFYTNAGSGSFTGG